MSDDAALGLIAGSGALPGEALAHLRKAGHDVRVFGFDGLCGPDIVPTGSCTRLGQLSALASLLRSQGIVTLLIVGGFDPTLAYSPGATFDPDDEALAMLSEIDPRDAGGLMSVVAKWLSKEGFELARQDEWLPMMLAGVGSITGSAPTSREEESVVRALTTLRSGSEAPFGQAFVLANGKVVAVEDKAGTDAMIRGCAGRVGTQSVVVKASRAEQDLRLDLPAIGPGTIAAMREVGATVLAVEAGSTLVIDREELKSLAESTGIRVWGFAPAGDVR